MEHASRGRRSGNKGVGARWRGRFRIFSARHCSRTKVSHAENSGMTMLFFSLEVAPVSEGVLTTGVVIRRRATTEWMARGGWFLFFSWRLLRCRRGILSHAQERTAPRPAAGQARGFWFGGFFHMLRRGRHEGVSFPGYVPSQERTARGGWFPGYVPSQERRHEEVLVLGIVSHARERQHEGLGDWGIFHMLSRLGSRPVKLCSAFSRSRATPVCAAAGEIKFVGRQNCAI